MIQIRISHLLIGLLLVAASLFALTAFKTDTPSEGKKYATMIHAFHKGIITITYEDGKTEELTMGSINLRLDVETVEYGLKLMQAINQVSAKGYRLVVTNSTVSEISNTRIDAYIFEKI